jgi:hypothetical protein
MSCTRFGRPAYAGEDARGEHPEHQYKNVPGLSPGSGLELRANCVGCLFVPPEVLVRLHEPRAAVPVQEALIIDGCPGINAWMRCQPGFDFGLSSAVRAAGGLHGGDPYDSCRQGFREQSCDSTQVSAFPVSGADNKSQCWKVVEETFQLCAQCHLVPVSAGRRLQHPVEVQEQDDTWDRWSNGGSGSDWHGRCSASFLDSDCLLKPSKLPQSCVTPTTSLLPPTPWAIPRSGWKCLRSGCQLPVQTIQFGDGCTRCSTSSTSSTLRRR